MDEPIEKSSPEPAVDVSRFPYLRLQETVIRKLQAVAERAGRSEEAVANDILRLGLRRVRYENKPYFIDARRAAQDDRKRRRQRKHEWRKKNRLSGSTYHVGLAGSNG